MKREGRQAAESEKGKKKARESKTRKEVNVKYINLKKARGIKMCFVCKSEVAT